MDFAKVLGDVGAFLEERGRSWAVVGGVGLAALGRARTTLDLDFVVEATAQDEIVEFLEAAGYETLYRSSGYSNHLHADSRRGRVDFVYVDEATAEALFAGCREIEGPGGVPMRVPRPEHLAAMKISALRNDPSRRFRELDDLRFLLSLPGTDRDEVRRRFEAHGLTELWDELASTL